MGTTQKYIYGVYRSQVQDSFAVRTWSAADIQNKHILLLRTGVTSIKRQAKPEPILCTAGHRIYPCHSKALTFWVLLGPRWPAHRWLSLSACQRSKRPPRSKSWSCWRTTLKCPRCTGPRDRFASGTRCRHARYSHAPPAKHCCLDSELHLQKWTTEED